jgi:hypothetical protein
LNKDSTITIILHQGGKVAMVVNGDATINDREKIESFGHRVVNIWFKENILYFCYQESKTYKDGTFGIRTEQMVNF